MNRLVIGLDSSTQSTKAIAWNEEGIAVAEGRCDIALSNPSLEKPSLTSSCNKTLFVLHLVKSVKVLF